LKEEKKPLETPPKSDIVIADTEKFKLDGIQPDVPVVDKVPPPMMVSETLQKKNSKEILDDAETPDDVEQRRKKDLCLHEVSLILKCYPNHWARTFFLPR